MDNKDLLDNFLNTVSSVKKNLQSKYQDQWNEPTVVAETPAKKDEDDEWTSAATKSMSEYEQISITAHKPHILYCSDLNNN